MSDPFARAIALHRARVLEPIVAARATRLRAQPSAPRGAAGELIPVDFTPDEPTRLVVNES